MDYFQDYNTELEALGTEPMGVSQDVHKDNLFKKSHAVDMEGTGMVERGLKTSFFDLWKAIRGYQEVHGHHPPFPQDEEKIKEAIFNSPHVQEAIRHFAIENSLTERQAHEKVRGMLDLMVAKFDSRVARSFEYVMTKVLRRLFVSIQVDERGLEMVKDIADTGVPIVLMPTHKSHIDYIVMSIICFHCNLSLPYIAAGDNLNIPVIGPLLRKAGAFFIRRQFGTDPLYAILFKEYVEQILRGGHMMEFFVEGGRSRSGKVLRPKMGLLSVIANAVMSQKIQDAVLIPISINYDKVVEGESYTKELLGANKTPESLMGVLKSAKLLKVKFGKVDVNFGTPISTARFLSRKEQQQFTKQSLTHTTDERTKPKLTNKQKETEAETEIQPEVEREEEDAENDDEKEMEAKETEEQNKATNTKDLLGEEPEPEVRRLIRALAYRVLYECNKVSMARPTALVATVLLTHHGRGISLSDLCSRVEQLCKEIVLRGGRVAGFNSGKGHSSLRLIENALAVLGSLVKHHKNLLEAVYEPIQRLELTFYKNSIVHWFVSEGMVALALYAAMKPSFRDLDNARVLKADILDRVKFISQLLKLEFIYKPSPDIIENFEVSLYHMQQRGIIRLENEQKTIRSGDITAPPPTSLLLSASSPSSSVLLQPNSTSDVDSANDVWISLDSRRDKNHQTFLFLCSLFWPFVDSYWLIASTARSLLRGNVTTTTSNFLARTRTFAYIRYFDGELNFVEAMSHETLTNALDMFTEMKVFRCDRVFSAKVTTVKLRQAYVKKGGKKLNALVDRIQSFRREAWLDAKHLDLPPALARL